MRLLIVLGLVSTIPLAGCQASKGGPALAAMPGKTAPAELGGRAEGPRRREPERVSLDLRVTKLGGGEALAVTRGDIETDNVVVFNTHRPGEGGGEAKLSVEVDPRAKGTYAVTMRWDETTAEGRTVSWAPVLVVAEGAEATAEIAWADGEGRRIVMKLTRTDGAGGEVAQR